MTYGCSSSTEDDSSWAEQVKSELALVLFVCSFLDLHEGGALASRDDFIASQVPRDGDTITHDGSCAEVDTGAANDRPELEGPATDADDLNQINAPVKSLFTNLSNGGRSGHVTYSSDFGFHVPLRR